MSELRYESFTVGGEEGTLDDAGAEFVRAIDYGFVERTRADDLVIAQLDRFRAEETVLTVAYDDEQDPRSLGAARPVATFGDFLGSVSVGGAIVEAQMVTEVTVRSTHRRRGILSTMMRGALKRAHDEGVVLSLLTASEGGIYGRFGYGAAAYSQRVSVKVHHGLRLRAEVEQAIDDAGFTIIIPTWEAFSELYLEAFPHFQERTIGQIGHTHAFRRRALGDGNGWALAGIDNDFRPLVVLDAAGHAAGFALTLGREGERRFDIADLGAVSPLAELALWQALGATDLIDELAWKEAPVDTVLPWALIDGRDVEFGARHDHLWLRVLDLPAAFAARGLASVGQLALTVTDREGFTAGTWLITREGDVTSALATPDFAEDVPHLALDAETLGSLYLGTVAVSVLTALGRATVVAGNMADIERLLARGAAPRNSYTF